MTEEKDNENKPTPEAKPEAKPEAEYAKAIADLKASYELKLEEQRQNLQKRIDERDKIIKDILTGEQKTAGELTTVEKINKKRDYPKW